MSPIPLGIFAVSGAAPAGAFDLLETTLISTSTASVTFSNLNNYSAYRHLQLRMVVRGAGANSLRNMTMRLNGETTNYIKQHRLNGNGATVTSSYDSQQDSLDLGEVPNNTATANSFGAIITDILDFSQTTKNKTIRSFSGRVDGNSTVVNFVSNARLSTSAITSIELKLNLNSLGAFSRFSLYGIKG